MTAAEDDPLEELELPATLPDSGLAAGTALDWAGERFVLTGDAVAGWYPALREGRPESLLLRPGAGGDFWVGLPKHRFLPRIVHAGPDGCVIEAAQGDPVSSPVGVERALEAAFQLAQLARFLLASPKNLALLDVDPSGLVRRDADLGIRFLPRVAPVGLPPPKVLREGITPPEVIAGDLVSGREGVYVTGAVLLFLLTGQGVPLDATSSSSAVGVEIAGVKQLLFGALEPSEKRIDIFQALEFLRALRSPPSPRYACGMASTVGLNPSRTCNEDSYAVSSRIVEGHELRTQQVCACVADGMGGMAAGETASRAAVDAFLDAVGDGRGVNLAELAKRALYAAWAANRAVVQALEGRDGGCTFTGLLISGSAVALAHAGDTRAYLVSGGALTQLTRDHSLVASLVANGVLTAEQAEHSPEQGKVLRSLGALRASQDGYIDGAEAVTGNATLELKPGDCLVLVSDGVWGDVRDAELLELVVRERCDPQRCADSLIEAVLQAGARDNATAVVVSRLQ